MNENLPKEIVKENLNKSNLIIGSLITLVIFSTIFILSGVYPMIAITVSSFIVLLAAGLVLRENKKTMYSRMFPDKKRRTHATFRSDNRIHEENREKNKNSKEDIKIYKRISLEVKKSKPLIRKCENCGMTLASFVKKCPKCQHQLAS